jgi:DNA-binding NtrC family response regulator
MEDLPSLVEHFREQAGGAQRVAAFDEGALRMLASYPWPGNVRELQNTVTRLVLTCASPVNDADVRRVLGEYPAQGIFSSAQLRSRPLPDLVSQLEKEYLLQLHSDQGGDLRAMAASLGITRRALYARFQKLGIRPREG